MSTSNRRKSRRESTAAYAASQPLFDALRNGVSRLDKQNANLVYAKDLVQQVHVKLPSVEENGPLKHEKYMDCIVRAWQTATEIYSEVFEALMQVTAADPTEAREALDGHETFKALAEGAANAQRLASGYEHTTSEPRSASPEVSTDTNNVGNGAGPSAPLTLLGKRPTLATPNESSRPQKLQKTLPPASNISREERAKLKAAKRQQRRSRLKAQKRSRENTAEQGESRSVQYEDVSAEVEARLKAKEAKKKEKKAEKKRKRESNGSAISVEPVDNKPKKKRVKADEDLGPEVSENQEKRKAGGEDAEEDPGEGRRKRLRRRI